MNDMTPLTIFAKNSIIDVKLGFKFVLVKTSWRRLSSLSSENVLKTLWSSRTISLHCSCVFKTSSRRLDRDEYIRLIHISSRRLQDFFKTSSRRLAITSSRRFQDAFKMYYQIKMFLLTRLQDVCCEDDYLQKNVSRPHVWETYYQGTNFPRVFLWQLETQLFASPYIWLAYIFEASYSAVVTSVSKKSSVDQSELEK